MRSSPLAAAVVAIALSAVPAIAQNGLTWIDGTTAEGGGVLIYGLPESDYVILSLRCDPTTLALSIAFIPDEDLPPAMSGVTLTLTSEGGKVALPAERVYLEMLDAEIVEATIEQLDPALVEIFTTGQALAVNADGTAMLLPIPDEAIRTPFLTACAVMG
ncbi:MAG: hypothetical protein KIT43_04495 [Bauldia sp.]|nr:hypothetical protein [Bauldia sp.]